MNYETADMSSMDALASQDIEEDNTEAEVDVASLSKNLAEDLDEDVLQKLSTFCKEGFDNDFKSRTEWTQHIKAWQDLALQVVTEKSYPWPGAANVKYPLLSTACMQFAARAYPSLVPSNGEIVKATVIGRDPQGTKGQKAERVSTYISYQCMRELTYWEEEMDKLLIMLPVTGCLFKKTYFNKQNDVIDSKLIMPLNLVVNYWTKRIEEAERVSEILEMSPRVLKEKQLQEIYLDVDLGPAPTPAQYDEDGNVVSDEQTTPYEIIEQHTYYDLDDDGYAEPVIVTFERHSGKILRVAIRYYQEDVKRNAKDKITQITPICMYTKYGFVPSFDGGFYDVGFGKLLGPLNESVNTLINQLLDSGTQYNLNAGFIGKSLRVRAGDTAFIPGEWKPVNGVGDDLRKQIVPLPAKEPSGVLKELLQFLVTAGKELASVAEIFTGKMPGQNTPATTTMASVEQGMKVFTAVYKRIYRSLGEEFSKFFCLNSKYLDPNKYVAVLDTTIDPSDFDEESVDVFPGADPTATSQNEKMMKVQGLMEFMQMLPGLLDPIQVAIRWMEATEQPNYQQLFTQQVQQTGQLPPPPPDPKVQALQMKAQIDQQKAQMDIAQKQQEMELDSRDRQMQMMMKAQEHAQDMQFEQQRGQLKAASELQNARVKMATAAMTGQQKIEQSDQAHQQKLQQTKETSKLSANSKSKTGSQAQSRKPTQKK